MDVINILLIIVGIINLFLSFIIYFNTGKSTKINKVFSLLALNVSFWSLAMAFFRWETNYETSLIALKTLYFIPIFIPIIFFFFIYLFLDNKYKIFNEGVVTTILAIWSSFIVGITIFTNKFLVNIQIPEIGEKIIIFGDWYILYVAHFLLFFGSAFSLLLIRYITDKDILLRKQITYLFLGTSISSTLGMVTNLLLPWFGYFSLNWVGNIMTIFLVGFILYAILKYQLLKMKVVTMEIFILSIFLILFVDIFFVTTARELFVKTFILMSVAILGYLMMRGVYKEIEAREKIEKLAEDLKHANVRLKKLDKQKSEFVSMASHQLRAPIASLKGYSSMILEGSYGPVSEKVTGVVTRLFQSSESLAFIINDFLNLSRIERGKIEYTFSKNNIKTLLENAVKQVKPTASENGLKLSLSIEKNDNYEATVDGEKLNQTFLNILNNSIKYTPKGSIDIKLSTKKNNIFIEISDTGIGIAEKDLPKLFKKFLRLGHANSVNVQGTGLGLFLAKEIITAHKGKIWAESEGEGKGSSFFIQIKGVKLKKIKKKTLAKPKQFLEEL